MIEQRPFGRTGHMSTATIFGGAALIGGGEKGADRALVPLKYGVNHIDTSPLYGDSELLIGPWMARHRKNFFLATKTKKRTCREAREEIRRSLERLRVDQVDLIQLHALVHPDESDAALGPEEPLSRGRGAGTGPGQVHRGHGHGWTIAAMHKRALQRFDFDSVLTPYNYLMHQNEIYRRDFEAVVRTCRERNVAFQTIKSRRRGPWGIHPHNRNPWYQPLEDQADIDKAVHWVLGNQDVFLNTVGDVDLLPKSGRGQSLRGASVHRRNG